MRTVTVAWLRLWQWFAWWPATESATSTYVATRDPVAQLLAVAEEAVAALGAGGATQEAIEWAEAAVETLDRLAGEDLFPAKLKTDPKAAVEFMELLAMGSPDLIGELISTHRRANPALAEVIRACGSGVAALGAEKEAAAAERRAVAGALHDFRAATAAHLVEADPSSPSAALAEHAPRLRERIATAKERRCPV